MAISALRVRLVFSQKSGATRAEGSRQRFGQDFAASLVRDLTFRAADEEYKAINKGIRESFAKDAKQELTHIAALYRRHIIGAGKTKTRPSGMLGYVLPPANDSVAGRDSEVAIAASLPAWAPRSPKYLREKERHNWGAGWFSAQGNLQNNMKAQNLLQTFGPIRVTVTKNFQEGAAKRVFNAGGGAMSKINVATVRVFALSNLTPEMLPGLRDQDPRAAISDKGNPGFYSLMKSHMGPAFASSVSGFSYAAGPGGRRYRPTLEPFLQFYLTRSIPNALAYRIQTGALRASRRNNG